MSPNYRNPDGTCQASIDGMCRCQTASDCFTVPRPEPSGLREALIRAVAETHGVANPNVEPGSWWEHKAEPVLALVGPEPSGDPDQPHIASPSDICSTCGRGLVHVVPSLDPSTPEPRDPTGRTDLCPDCGHHLHRPNPGKCQWYDCPCGAAPSTPEPSGLREAAQAVYDTFLGVEDPEAEYAVPHLRALERLDTILRATPSTEPALDWREELATIDAALRNIERVAAYSWAGNKHALTWAREARAVVARLTESQT